MNKQDNIWWDYTARYNTENDHYYWTTMIINAQGTDMLINHYISQCREKICDTIQEHINKVKEFNKKLKCVI